MTPRIALTLLALLPAGATLLPDATHAATPTFSTLGGAGTWATPSARTAPAGTLTLGGHYASPDAHVPLFYQPLERLELGFRYSQRLPRDGEPRRHYDPQLDLKWRLSDETRYLPAVALGARDIGHTAAFNAEYLVASKRWNAWDVSLGVGWGALGSAADAEAPFDELDERWDTRSAPAASAPYQESDWFKGPASLFGGITYQTPWQPLQLALEYTGGDATQWPPGDTRDQASRWQGGAHLALSDPLTLKLGWARGDTLSAGLHYRFDLNQGATRPSPAPVIPLNAGTLGWADTARTLARHDVHVHEVSRTDDAMTLHAAYQGQAHDAAAAYAYTNALLYAKTAATGPDTPPPPRQFRYRWERAGMPLREDVYLRDAIGAAQASSTADTRQRHSVYAHAVLGPVHGTPLYQASRERFDWSLRPLLEQNAGSQEHGYRYRLAALAEARYTLPDTYGLDGWFTGGLDYTLAENLTRPPIDPLNDAEPTRSLRGYYAETPLTLSHLQYNQAAALDFLGDDWFGMAYGGLLETQYAGVGAELLYRPFASPLAWSLNAARVRSRDFEDPFALRDADHRWTGDLTAYLYPTNDANFLLEAGLHRYLGGDSGVRLGATHDTPSGVSIHLAAAFSHAHEHTITPTLTLGFPLGTPGTATDTAMLRWQALDSDSGSVLKRRERLFELTRERRVQGLW